VQEYQNRFTHKTSVIGMLDRESRQIRAKVVPNVKRETLQKEILSTIKPGSKVYTDQAVAYDDALQKEYIHETVNHAVEYVRGEVHTNGLESFWSLLKRNLAGTYVCVEPFHLDRYLAEQVFRYNHRKQWNDQGRFELAMNSVAGKRLTYCRTDRCRSRHVTLRDGKGEANVIANPCWLSSFYVLALEPHSR
jgi:transposase-like protein